MKPIEFNVMLYHREPFDLEVRESFSFIGNPYRGSKDGLCQSCEYLKDLGVFFYRDQWHVKGIIWGNPQAHCPFSAYQSIIKVLADQKTRGVGVSTWENSKVRHPIYKDSKAWIAWNREVKIVQVHEVQVKYERSLPKQVKAIKDGNSVMLPGL